MRLFLWMLDYFSKTIRVQNQNKGTLVNILPASELCLNIIMKQLGNISSFFSLEYTVSGTQQSTTVMAFGKTNCLVRILKKTGRDKRGFNF